MIISNTQNTSALNSIKSDDDLKNQNSVKALQAERYDTFVKQGETTESVTYQPPKKLTKEQVDEINRQRVESTIRIMTDAIQNNLKTQAAQVDGVFEFNTDSADLLTEIFGSVEAAYPTPATTPEGALADISEGGAYSVEAVSERILKMATSIAGDNPELLAELKSAVQEGFVAAGLDLNTGDGMPEITMDTYNHVMAEFDKLLGEE